MYINGKYIYLGPYDSPESQAKYRRVVGHYIATGNAPDDDNDELGEVLLTVADVTAEAREWIKTHFASDSVQRHRFSGLCTLLEDECGDLPANDFRPRKLAELRELTYSIQRNSWRTTFTHIASSQNGERHLT